MSSRSKPPTKTSEYIETENGNKISRQAQVLGARHITLSGKCVVQPGVIIRGDLVRILEPPTSLAPDAAKKPSQPTSIKLGRYVFVGPGAILHPPSRLITNEGQTQLQHQPLTIGSHVYIGPDSTISAARIGDNVYVGKKVHVGNLVIINDNVKILDGTVLPERSTWASGFVVGGSPGRVVGLVGEGWGSGSGSTEGNGFGGSGEGDWSGPRCRERYAAVGSKR